MLYFKKTDYHAFEDLKTIPTNGKRLAFGYYDLKNDGEFTIE
jgi:hypothetical protein